MEGDNIIVKYALRDEIINIYALTHGGFDSYFSHQILLCKRQFISIDLSNPLVLDLKKSDSIYKKSSIGLEYLEKIKNENFSLEYVAFVDCHIKIKVQKQLLNSLYNRGYFNIWLPEAPYEYFSNDEGYLILLRVFKISSPIQAKLLDHGRGGRNSYFKLSNNYYLDRAEPVINDEKFNDIKTSLIKLIQEKECYLNIINSDYEFNNTSV